MKARKKNSHLKKELSTILKKLPLRKQNNKYGNRVSMYDTVK